MKHLKVVAVLAIIMFISLPVRPQYDIHMIIGYVYADGKAIPKVNLTIINEDRMEKIYKMTDKYGFFSFNTGSFRGPGWKNGERLRIIVRGEDAYEGWKGEGKITIDYNSYYQWINITMIPMISADFSYTPDEPTDIDTIKFHDLSGGKIVNYTWNFGDGNISYEQNPSHEYADDGIYNVTLTVTDDDGNKATKVKKIIVNNVPPFPVLYYTISNNMIEVNASKSYDKDGKIIKYEWKWDDGEWYYGRQVEKHHIENGEHLLSVRLIDDDGGMAELTIPIYITKENMVSPVANFTWMPSNPTTSDIVHFTSTSYDDGNIVNYTWNFGDGNISYEQNPTHKYERKGKYNVTLTVVDNDGGIGKVKKVVNIVNSLPVADFSYRVKNMAVYFTSTSYDDGNIVNYTWNFGDGNISYEQNPTHKYERKGKYNVTLTVVDNDGGIGKVKKVVNIAGSETPSFLTIYLVVSLVIALFAKKKLKKYKL